MMIENYVGALMRFFPSELECLKRRFSREGGVTASQQHSKEASANLPPSRQWALVCRLIGAHAPGDQWLSLRRAASSTSTAFSAAVVLPLCL